MAGNKAGGAQGVRRKRKDERLASVVRETAPEAAIALLRENTRFAFPSEGAWVILVLEADSIGGLSKRQSRDEAKGLIISLIDSDIIQTVATEDMLEEEFFGIIPTADTLSRMSEFSLLTNARYGWAVVHPNGMGGILIKPVADGNFAQAMDVSSGAIGLVDVVGSAAWAAYSGLPSTTTLPEQAIVQEVAPETPQQPTSQLLPEFPPGFVAAGGEEVPEEDSAPLADPSVIIDDEDADYDSGPEQSMEEELADYNAFIEESNSEFELSDASDQSDDFDDASGDESDYDDEEEEEEADPAYDAADIDDNSDDDLQDDEVEEVLGDLAGVNAALARRFVSEDLDMAIPLDEFQRTFNVGALTVQMDVPAAMSPWLSEQVATLTAQANMRLEQARRDSETKLQTQFVNLMSLHAEKVTREVSTDQDGSPYKGLLDAARDEHRANVAASEDQTRKRVAEINNAFEDHVRVIGEQAAQAAQAQYRERNRARIEREHVEAAASVTAKIENDYIAAKQEILALRRESASYKMALGQSRIFDMLAAMQQESLAEERELLAEQTEQIRQYIDENRQIDISRHEALLAERATTDRMKALHEEHEAKLARVRAENEARMQQTYEDFERQRQESVNMARSRDGEWQHLLELERAKTAAESHRVQETLGQMQTMEQSFRGFTESRVAEMHADRASYQHDMERSIKNQGRVQKILVSLSFVLTLLGVAAGFIVGRLVG